MGCLSRRGIAGHYYDVWTIRLWVTGSLRQGLRGQVHVHERRLLLPAATVCGGKRPVELPLLSRDGVNYSRQRAHFLLRQDHPTAPKRWNHGSLITVSVLTCLD